MTRLRQVPLAVETEGDLPRRLARDGDWEKVETILDCWRDAGCWWQGEEEKLFFRLCTGGGRVLEIYRQAGSGDWYLYREYD